MAKHIVLSCELDGEIDSAENRVVTANLCGHRVELCKTHRVKLLTLVGVSEEHAIAYCDVYDQRVGIKGPNLSMAQVVEMLAEQQADVQAAEVQAETTPQELVDAPSAEDTEGEVPPARKRK